MRRVDSARFGRRRQRRGVGKEEPENGDCIGQINRLVVIRIRGVRAGSNSLQARGARCAEEVRKNAHGIRNGYAVFSGDMTPSERNDGLFRAELNDVNIVAAATSHVLRSGEDVTSIGCTREGGGLSGEMSGRIAAAAVWNAVLDDDDAHALAVLKHHPLIVKRSNLVACWHLFADEDTDCVGSHDLSDYNNPGTADHPPGLVYPPWYYHHRSKMRRAC